MQRVEIIGVCGKDAEVKDFGNNQVINFSVAVSEKIKEETKTTWFEIQKWGNNVNVAPYIKKGTKVFIAGKPANRSFINNSGESVVVNGINAFEIELLSSQKETETSAPSQQKNPESSQSNFKEEEHDDLPF